MKINKAIKYSILAWCCVILIAACKNNDQPAVVTKAEKAIPKSVNPFPFYKDIEIKLGYHFEVLSWGKGIDTVGGFLLLMSDSLKNNYKSLAVERKGIITDAWNMDLDNDGNPELYIQYVVRKNVNDLNVYEFSGNSFAKISFPGLKSSLKKNYHGNDKFFVKNGDLYRTVPIVETTDGKTTTTTKTLKYRLSENSFSVSEAEE